MTIGNIIYTLLISPLRLVFEVVFAYANSILNHPGLSIIVLSLAINLLVLPLYRRSDAMQEEERDIQAKLKDGVSHIKKTFKGDERMMILQTYYRQNNYKPTYVLRGAMSLFLEIPFFIAAYSFLSNLVILTGVSLGPIRNLAQPDGLLTVFGVTINLLPIVMTAVNCVSTVIFTKGYPARTKVQLYAMAAFFLVFLYNSPSGLVFYWTLNNVFSLVKTIFYKLKHPKKVLAVLSAVCGVGAIVLGALCYSEHLSVFVVLAVVLELPLVIGLVKKLRKASAPGREDEKQPSGKRFFAGAVFLSVLAGLWIPSSVLKASPLEFVSSTAFYHPLWYVVSAACLSFGFFTIWLGVFYWLTSPKGKVIFERALFILCGIAVVDYFFFGRDLGVLSSSLKYENGLGFETAALLVNATVVLAVGSALYWVSRRWQDVARSTMFVCVLAAVAMSAVNVIAVGGSVRDFLETTQLRDEGDDLEIRLSRTGKNVVVLMLDRAAAHLVPYVLEENPTIAEQFSGFTFYDNTISYGGATNLAAPALYGGYEYTPTEIALRDDESVESKHNEALKVMPVMFSEAGYDVTVYDPPYAGYQEIPDLSIYDDYPEIRTGITIGAFNEAYATMAGVEKITQNRNFFCYSLMKMAPLALQSTLYDKGNYRHLTERAEAVSAMDRTFASYPVTSTQVTDSTYTAHGVYSAFLDSYTVLTHLSDMTQVTDDETGCFLMMSNNTAHDQMLLQQLDYTPSYMVDNSAYESEYAGGLMLNGRTIYLDDVVSMEHYHINTAALLQLGSWFDYLRELGVYDNTRIILVADHNRRGVGEMQELYVETENGTLDITAFNPLLMVKNFGAEGVMETDSAFMTNADVPTLATEGVIENPTNPFTGKAIDNSAKQGVQYITDSLAYLVDENNGNVFLPDNWYSVHDDLWDADNWQYEGYGVLPEDLVP